MFTSILIGRIQDADWPEGPDNLAVIRITGVTALLNTNYMHNVMVLFGTTKIGRICGSGRLRGVTVSRRSTVVMIIYMER